MTKYSQGQLKKIVRDGKAVDITNGTADLRKEIKEAEGNYAQVGYVAGICGCNGKLLKGEKTGTLYAITARTTALFIF